MKDYYYFLGISTDASLDDIKKAYRKLAHKYHPDKNENDVFFVERFREVQEAYETLTDSEKRKVYDSGYLKSVKERRSDLPPFIKTFSANRIRAMKGEEIILYWQTNNSDMVKILPFGLVEAYGERKFKVSEFKDGKFHVVLQATNTLLNRTVVKGITITEVFEPIKLGADEKIEGSYAPKPEDLKNASPISARVKIILAIVLIVLTLLLIIFKP